MQNLGASVESMSTSNERVLELEKILTVISINESGVRTFIITRDSSYLQKRFFDQKHLKPQMERLKALSIKSPTENFTTDSLKLLLDKRFELFNRTLEEASQNTKLENPDLNFILAQTDTATDKIRDYIHKSLNKELSNINLYRINHKYEIETSIITSFLLVTIALFIILLSLGRINSDIVNLKILNDDLKFLNYTFNNAEKIAGISHWNYNLRTHEYSFSDNFYNLIGLDQETFKPTLENVLPYIHPDDRDQVVEAYADSLRNKTPTSLIFRLYRKNGEIRYIKSIGSFAENSHGEMVKIGVNYDITEHYKNTIDLEDNNKHLTDINAELESFNNIVSHDLQEPLRKIQMFISRIDENEIAVLSENGKDYINRIALSANRMQNLLIDLVSYSRTVKGDKVFEKADLNNIVGEVLADLAINIQEKNAKLKVGNLPVINAIPFQLHQLFVNLITNSLKFSRQDVVSEISFSQQKISTPEVYDGINFTERKFHKIVISDNGIGFRQEFADKIFQLFKRLEKDIDYAGTGIGLAICKKIVENHKGYIFAEGRPGKGAKFIIFFPK